MRKQDQLDPGPAAARDQDRFTGVRQLAKPVKSLASFLVCHRFHVPKTGPLQSKFLCLAFPWLAAWALSGVPQPPIILDP